MWCAGGRPLIAGFGRSSEPPLTPVVEELQPCPRWMVVQQEGGRYKQRGNSKKHVAQGGVCQEKLCVIGGGSWNGGSWFHARVSAPSRRLTRAALNSRIFRQRRHRHPIPLEHSIDPVPCAFFSRQAPPPLGVNPSDNVISHPSTNLRKAGSPGLRRDSPPAQHTS